MGSLHYRRQVTSYLFVGLIALPLLTSESVAFTPDSPEVRAMLDRASDYFTNETDPRIGGQALIGLALLKDGNLSHPRVAEALAAAVKIASPSVDELAKEQELYALCMATMFLCEYDSVKYADSIGRLLTALWQRQHSHGGFGYFKDVDPSFGDTSMTQYVVLSAWTAHHSKLPINWDAVHNVLGWLVRTQDIGGGWGYQALDPGAGQPRKKQRDVRLSLAAGGLGSVYICADLLGAGDRLKTVSPVEAKLPSAFRLVGEEDQKKRRGRAIDSTLLSAVKRSTLDGNEFFGENFKIPYGEYDHYYLYALERYKSFREQIDKSPDVNPDWYDQGVRWLASQQQANGGWKGQCQHTADTAFACLFLMRSTQKSIKANLGQGLLTGGRGIPKDAAHVRIRAGKIVAEPLTASPEEIMSIMEDPDHPDFAALADNPESVLAIDPGRQKGAVQRIRRQILTGKVEARRLAVKALSHHRDLENVPVLIFALGDRDPQVMREARDALRFISRRFDGFGISDTPTEEEQEAGIMAWKDWYRSIRPDAKFLE